MDKLEAIKQKIQEMPETIKEAIELSFSENDTIIEDMNIEQLEEGKRSDGVSLPDYSPRSVEVFGKPAGAIRLKETGAFHRGIQLKVSAEVAELMSTDSKTEELKQDYGDEIIGLSEENAEEFKNDYLKPTIHERIKLKIG